MSVDNYPMKRELDGIYVRVQRDGEWDNICFSDMTTPERDTFLARMDVDGLKRTCHLLAEVIHAIGDRFNIICSMTDTEDA